MDRDRDGGTYQGVGGSSSGDDVHESSFMTASDGNADQDEPIRSSRSMPVPEHMMRKSRESLHIEESRPLQAQIDAEDAATLPSYNEVMSHPDVYGGSRSEQRDNEDELTPEEIAIVMRAQDGDNHSTGRSIEGDDFDGRTRDDVSDNDLTPAQTAMLLQHQANRNSYLERKHSFEEAIEMLPKDYTNGASPGNEHALPPPNSGHAPPPLHFEQMEIQDVEGGQERKEFACSGWGPLDGPMTSFCRLLRRQSRSRLVLFSLLIIGCLGLLLFVSLFPASFVYIDYHEIALKQSKMTNVVDRDTVYYHGCYVLGPDTHLVKFDASVHNVIEEMSVFTLDTIAVKIRYSAHYFLRAPEIGKLYTLFMFDYDEVFRMIIRSSLRNLAGTTLTVDNFRFNRTHVETQIHAMLRKRLGGDCCPDCCNEKPPKCQSNAYCSQCRREDCDQGYHIDVRMFNLLSVSIPNEVFEKLLLRTIMEVHKEKEFFLQEHSVVQKKTDFLVKNISNHANQLIEAGKSEATKIMMIAEGEHEKIVQQAHITGLKGLFSRLNVTIEDKKLSLMMLRGLEDNAENIFASYGFEEKTLYVP